jgi:hypothetical protein
VIHAEAFLLRVQFGKEGHVFTAVHVPAIHTNNVNQRVQCQQLCQQGIMPATGYASTTYKWRSDENTEMQTSTTL